MRPVVRVSFVLAALACLAALCPAEEPAVAIGVGPAALDPNLPYQAERSNAVTYDVDFRAIVTAPYHTKRLRVWLPIPPSDFGKEVSKRELSAFPMAVKPRLAKETDFG